MRLKHYIILYVIVLAHETSALHNIKVESLLKMQIGIGWPRVLNITEGHEALLKLSRLLVNQQTCSITTPTGLTFDVRTPPSNRYESWSEGCGVRVRNVAPSDTGRWRLTAIRGNESITGWSEVFVEERPPSYTGSVISLQDGQTRTEIELTSLNNTYCLVAQPFSESALVPGHCRVTLDRATRAVQGSWDVVLGIPGQVSEMHVARQVAVEAESLDVGYVQDVNTNKLHLYCNILYTSKNITFCRFQKTTNSTGFNVMDGLSNGAYSYYGDGFMQRHCGMTIETPTEQDYGTWRCSIGLQQWVGNHIVPQSPMQALISVANNNRSARVARNIEVDVDGVSNVFVQENTRLTIMCNAHVSLTYCWFQHPNGSQYASVPLVDEEQPFWYTGQSLQAGDCGIIFSHVHQQEAGEWTCHMGPSNQMGVEITERVNVRVTGALAANRKGIETSIGGTVTLYCHTANGRRSMEYCRFLSPNYVGFNIDSSVTEENAILNRYYFTPGRDLNHGDCSLTINPVEREDLGEWSCAGLVDEETMESRDTLLLFTESSNSSRLQAGLIGMSVGLGVLVIVLGGVLWYNRKRIVLPRRAPAAPADATVTHTFDRRNTVASTNSTDSNTSNEVYTRA